MKIITVAEVPDDLGQAWLQHMRDFDVAHPGCHFNIVADAPALSIDELRDILRGVGPAFHFLRVQRRR